MIAQSSQSVPIYTGRIAQLTTKRRRTNPNVFGGGLSGCGCGPVGGCGCSGGGLSGLAQSVSLDQIIANAANWLGGYAQSQLPASASLPPQYGSAGALSTTLQQWLPWIIGGYLVYKVVSK